MRIAGPSGRRKPIKRKLTQAWCRSVAPPTEGRLVVHDTATPGLVLTVTAKGSRAWYLYKKIDGKPRRFKLADADVALEDARKLFYKELARFHDGKNPAAERRRRRQRVTTLAELWTLYGEERERTPRTITAETSLWKQVGAMDRRALDSIKVEDVAALHSRIGKKRKVTANRVVQLVRRLFRFARRRRLYTGDNPAEGLELYPERGRERYVKPSELPALLAAIDAEADPWPDYFRLLLLTGARRSALAAMKWADLDLNAKTWAIPASDSKNKTGITVALVPEAVTRLERRLAASKENAKYVFPAPSKEGHVVNPYEAWKRIRDAAKMDNLTMHDLRHTTGSYLAAAGVSAPMIGKALGHRSMSSTMRYMHLDVESIREELAHVADAMAAATPTQKGNT
ncbi:MAG: tyrosine-type recombinase/integrase [Phycisphaeraceae bacterium]